MNRFFKVSLLIIALCWHHSLWAESSLLTSAEWPFSPPTLFLKGGVNAVTSGSDLLFWAMGDTIEVIEKDSFLPLATFRVSTSTAIQDMLYDDSTKILYVAAGYDEKDQSGGLQIFNISDPAHPGLLVVFDKSINNPGSYRKTETENVDVPDIDARGIGLFNGILFLADDNFGLRVIDVTSNPSQPTEVDLSTPTDERTSGYKQPDINDSFTATGGYVNLSLYPYGDKVYAFVLDFFHGVKVFDVTDPQVIEDPVLKDTRTQVWFGSVSLLSDFFVTETNGRLTAFVTGGDATGSNFVVSRLDVSFDEELPIANFGRCITPGEARSVSVSGDYAYVADGSAGLSIVDISDVPETGSVLTYTKAGSFTNEVDFSYNVFIDGATLYLASGESGLNRLNVSDPVNPALLNRLESPISGDDVCVSGDYTYMLDRKRGLRVFYSKDSNYLLLRGFLAYEGDATDLAVSGNYAYISDRNGYIFVISINDPSTPIFTGITIVSPSPQKLFIKGSVLYIADAVSGLRLVDISAPLNPENLGSVATTGPAVSVYVHTNRAYVAEGEDGIDIFDISNSFAPVLITSAAMADARDVCVLVNGSSLYALVADGAAGLKILDVSDTDNPLSDPVVVNTMDTGTETPKAFNAVSVAVLGELAFVGMGSDGILALDLKIPQAPVEIDHELSYSYTRDIVPQTNSKTPYLTVAERFTGFRILYLYSSSETDDTGEFIPTVDAGCFIGSVSAQSSLTENYLAVLFHAVVKMTQSWVLSVEAILNPPVESIMMKADWN